MILLYCSVSLGFSYSPLR